MSHSPMFVGCRFEADDEMFDEAVMVVGEHPNDRWELDRRITVPLRNVHSDWYYRGGEEAPNRMSYSRILTNSEGRVAASLPTLNGAVAWMEELWREYGEETPPDSFRFEYRSDRPDGWSILWGDSRWDSAFVEYHINQGLSMAELLDAWAIMIEEESVPQWARKRNVKPRVVSQNVAIAMEKLE